ncbi:intradiol ring-cleavage dioxygenase [Pontibacter saemangeumensis]
MDSTRRTFIVLVASLPLMGFLARYTKTEPASLPPTPSCDDHDEPTPRQTEGPYFKPASPERSSLLQPGLNGTKLILAGQVLNTDCQPVAKALLDWWHCDSEGNYDNDGYTLRGHQYTDKQGNFRLETIVPGLYPGRTRHIHVKVQAPGQPVLTTQLYFPEEAQNQGDGIFNEVLVMKTQKKADYLGAGYTFVLKA